MVHRALVFARSGSRDCGPAPKHLPRVSAAAEARQLLGRPGHGKTFGADGRQLAASRAAGSVAGKRGGTLSRLYAGSLAVVRSMRGEPSVRDVAPLKTRESNSASP